MTHTLPTLQALAGNVSRRRFFSVAALAGAATVAAAGSARAATFSPQPSLSTSPIAAVGRPTWKETGADLSGWEMVIGDALYAVPGQADVGLADIATVHSGRASTLRANVQRRGIMAHNITFKRLIDTTLFDSVHVCRYQFRMPYLPVTGAWPDNAQTVEGGFFLWDGGDTRLDYGLAFQWVLNPWQSDFGVLNAWTGTGWERAGYLAPDTEWHTLRMTFDRRNNLATMSIDDTPVPTALTATPKASYWGNETAARLQAEIVSLWPGSNPVAPSHRAKFRNWTWTRRAYV